MTRRPKAAGLRATAAAIASVIALAAPAGAVTVADYQKWRHATRTLSATPTGLIEVRLGGILRGLMLANRRLDRAGGPVLFCPAAAGGGMAGAGLRKRLDAELKAPSRTGGAPWPPDTGIATVVLHILQRLWRCPPGRRTLPAPPA